MKIIDRIGDHALQRAKEFRDADPKLSNPLKSALTQLAEWAFIGKFVEMKFTPQDSQSVAPPPASPEAGL